MFRLMLLYVILGYYVRYSWSSVRLLLFILLHFTVCSCVVVYVTVSYCMLLLCFTVFACISVFPFYTFCLFYCHCYSFTLMRFSVAILCACYFILLCVVCYCYFCSIVLLFCNCLMMLIC